MADEDLPFTAEYAKSGRSSCKTCRRTIDKDVLRLGIMIQSPNFDGKIPLWHHESCFFKKTLLRSTGDIKHFLSLRYEDQQRLKDKVGTPGKVKPSSAKGRKKKAAAAAVAVEDDDSALDPKTCNFFIQYAISSRSSCRVCAVKIEKGSIRISKLDTESAEARRYGQQPGWHHVDCFVKMRSALEFNDSGDMLPNFASLSDEDKEEIKKKLKKTTTGSKRKNDVVEEKVVPPKVAKKDNDEEKALKEQSKLFYGFRDALQSQMKKKDLVSLLEVNGQLVPAGESRILDTLADCLAFGPLNPCPECKGQLRFGSSSYKCGGSISGWTNCQYTTQSPERRRFNVPEDFKNYDFLKKYKYVKRQRIFPQHVEVPSASKASDLPLSTFKIFILGNLKRGNEIATEAIAELGGKVMKKMDKNTTCIITNEEEATKYETKIKTAEKKKTLIVSEEFLDEAKSCRNIIQLLREHKLYDWGINDSLDVLGVPSTSTTKSKLVSKVSKSKMQKVTVEGKVAVDPDAMDKHHLFNVQVYEKDNEVFSAVLGMVDIQRGTNSFYKLQMLKSNYSERYHIFRSWGRVGTNIGDTKLEHFDDALSAVMKFKDLYLEKTDNDWDDRADFQKAPNRFYPMDIDYGQEALEKNKELKPESSSMLTKPVQELICMLFDVESMKKTMLEFEIDMQKMPLGKISKKQIQTAYSVLSAAQELIKNATANKIKILDESNKFYTLIPHDFGMKNPPLLDNEHIIQMKTEMLESLMEIEVAYAMLQEGKDVAGSALDQHYKQLKTEIKALDKYGDEFQTIEKYLHNTHAATHSAYTLHIEDVFKINRNGETDRYSSTSKKISNKKLLWHGSRTTNYVGILSQGLRIAPPEAPATGYMFGKGIYFADMVSKSANYCFVTPANPNGLLILCEVALGNMHELEASSYIQKLPNGKHSTKGMGQTHPNPSGSVMKDGVEIPLGKPMTTKNVGSSLLYNEYIIYDINQVNIKYLLKVRFDYGRGYLF